MRSTHRLGSLRFLLASVASCAMLLSLLIATPSAQASVHVSTKGIGTSLLHINPLYNDAVEANTALLPCLSNTTVPLCYSPQQIRRAYGIQGLLDKGIKGQGRTIVIVDAFQSPTIRSDLKLFDKIFSLPDPRFNIIAPFGLTPFNFRDPAAVSFAIEISLDVEWAHAVAPAATIDLVLGNPASDNIQAQLNALVLATKYAVDNDLGSTISQSFGAGETCLSASALQTERETFRKAREEHITVFASSGDAGSAVAVCNSAGTPVAVVQGVNYPASDPLVSAVGGTSLFAAKSGAYINETTWSQPAVNGGATGGGFSILFPRPRYQNGIAGIGDKRGVPDVSYDADPQTGVPVVISALLPNITLILPVGGTSAGSPQWAAIAALIDQAAGKRLGFLNGTFYRIAKNDAYSRAFHDITVGNNSFTFQINGKITTIPGYNASPGWDPTTGVGSPKTTNLANIVLKYYDSEDGNDL